MSEQQKIILSVIAGAAIWLMTAYIVDRRLSDSRSATGRVAFRLFAALVTIGGFFYGLHQFVDNHELAVNITKGVLAFVAAMLVFYEARREGQKRPISERWKKFIGLALGIAAITAYFNGFKWGYGHYFHRWDQYHYYMGAKYFREIGYDGLYKCALIAQDDMGVVDREDGDDPDYPNRLPIDMTKEVRHGDKKIRNLGGDNLTVAASQFLEHPEVCKSLFSPERWELFKHDVRYFRLSSDKQYWEDMQRDHGFNPPPVWTIMGRFFAELHPANMRYLQLLAGIDIVFLAGAFIAIYWAFGWRVFSVGAIFWGCQAAAPFYWTGGAFLRQDWFFLLVLAACLTRKRYFKLAGASMVYAGLLRIFPGLCVIGWLTVAGWTLFRKRRLEKHQMQMLFGGVLAAAVLIPTSLVVVGKDSYQQFYAHTLQVHDRTPLTNHMGLRVIVAHKFFPSNASSGRMKFVRDNMLADPFKVWKDMRNARYDKYRYVAYGFTGLVFALFVYVTRRVRNMWVAQCLAQVFVILMSQLTCYYYSFMILTAPLIRIRKDIEAPLFGVALLTQILSGTLAFNDDKYTAETIVTLAFSITLLLAIAPRSMFAKVRQLFGRSEPAKPATN